MRKKTIKVWALQKGAVLLFCTAVIALLILSGCESVAPVSGPTVAQTAPTATCERKLGPTVDVFMAENPGVSSVVVENPETVARLLNIFNSSPPRSNAKADKATVFTKSDMGNRSLVVFSFGRCISGTALMDRRFIQSRYDPGRSA